MKGKYFIVEFITGKPRIMRLPGEGITWFETKEDAKLTGCDLCGTLNEDYIICQKP